MLETSLFTYLNMSYQYELACQTSKVFQFTNMMFVLFLPMYQHDVYFFPLFFSQRERERERALIFQEGLKSQSAKT